MAAMKYRKDSAIEVLNKASSTPGSWRRGRIVSGNGHYYDVQLDHLVLGGGRVERFPRKRIRPCPPDAWTREPWVLGDEVEVFSECRWRVAVLLDVNFGGDGCCRVRWIGTTETLTVPASAIRPRLCWLDDKWVRSGKSSFRNTSSPTEDLAPVVKRGPPSPSKNIDLVKASRKIPSKGRKRPRSPVVDPDARLEAKVDTTAAYAKKQLMSKKQGQAWGDEYSTLECQPSCSSVASCSEDKRRGMVYNHANSSGVGVPEDCSDAQSCCWSSAGRQETKSDYKKLASEFHELQLHVYRRTLETMFSSGYISWDQEAFLTDLRFLHHVSNDEHRLILRNMVSNRLRSG